MTTKTTWEYVNDYPEWVKDTIAKIRKRHGGTSSSLRDRTWELKGKHYRYKVSFEGQGGYEVVVARRPRKHTLVAHAT